MATASSRGRRTSSRATGRGSARSGLRISPRCPTRPRTATAPTSSPVTIRRRAMQATAALRACVDHLRVRFREAIDGAAGLLDDEGAIIEAEVVLDTDCELDADTEQRAKCGVLGEFRSGTARGAGLLLAQQLGRRGGSGRADRRRQSAGPEPAGAESDPRPARQRRRRGAARSDDRVLRAPRRGPRRRGVRTADHPRRAQQGQRPGRSGHRQDHGPDARRAAWWRTTSPKPWRVP